MSTGLIELIKTASLNAMENAQMTDLRFGKVTSTNPLKVQVTSQFTIPESLLIVPRHLTDYTVRVNFEWESEYVDAHSHSYVNVNTAATTGTANKHRHTIKSENDNKQTKEIKILNHLKVGDKVALLRKQGGQSYYILDRIDD